LDSILGVRDRKAKIPHCKVGSKEMAGQAYCGVDVAKATLSACVLIGTAEKGKVKEFENGERGYQALMDWAKRVAGEATVRFCVEATGRYSWGVSEYLATTGEKLSVPNPARVKAYGVSAGILNKTDPADARTIAMFARALTQNAWRAPTPAERRLEELARRIEALERERQREKIRLQQPGLDKLVQRSIRRMQRTLEREIARFEEAVREHIAAQPEMKENERLLRSIPGIGEKTAWWFLATVRDVRAFPKAKAVMAYIGLSPCQHESGSSIRKRAHIGRTGGRMLRKVLYMAAKAAILHNALVREFGERLLAKGKPWKVVVVACMRKLATIAFGVCRTQTTFTCT